MELLKEDYDVVVVDNFVNSIKGGKHSEIKEIEPLLNPLFSLVIIFLLSTFGSLLFDVQFYGRYVNKRVPRNKLLWDPDDMTS